MIIVQKNSIDITQTWNKIESEKFIYDLSMENESLQDHNYVLGEPTVYCEVEYQEVTKKYQLYYNPFITENF